MRKSFRRELVRDRLIELMCPRSWWTGALKVDRGTIRTVEELAKLLVPEDEDNL